MNRRIFAFAPAPKVVERVVLLFILMSFLLVGSDPGTSAQQSEPNIRVKVELVQLNVAVMDRKGRYITGLNPSSFRIMEDGIPQKIATFGEGDEAVRTLIDVPPEEAGAAPSPKAMDPPKVSTAAPSFSSAVTGASVFVLFDTSNYMYRGFVFAQDAIAQFIRSLDKPDRIAFYSYSRDLSKASSLTADRTQVLRGVRSTVAGDDAALYNALLMTIKDAGQYTGRKVVVVFSNGPDNASMVPPEDVAELAQSKGIPIYMISTREASLDPVSSTVFRRLTAATGGEAYFAKNWRDQQKAFASIREDLQHLYALSYYPQPNPNRGWRAITVKLVGEHSQKYRIRTRDGYRPLPTQVPMEQAISSSE
ncbi:MAG TPA: VWA domain-containing protein [Terriglobales bacterium]|nr:VWA domain-containing protein [Terriglobales bacterium]